MRWCLPRRPKRSALAGARSAWCNASRSGTRWSRSSERLRSARWLSGRRGPSAPEGRPVKIYEYDDRYFGKQHCAVSQTAIKLVVLHSTEGPSAEGGAITLSSRSDVSAHLCVGEGVTYRIVPEWLGSCTVQEPNDWTLNIEQVGRASCRERVEISVVAVLLKKKN